MTSTLAALRRGDLAGARELRLPGLDTLPAEVLGLADTLEVLDVAGGTLTDLPDDFGRLKNLRVFFGSGNRFARLPPVLGDCPALTQIGCRGAGVHDVPGEALPPLLRWLTLTQNAIATLPDALGARPHLQKLMLAGNRLSSLPDALEGANSLELIRLSANRFEDLPDWLSRLPRLAWASWAGNPVEPARRAANPCTALWHDLTVGALLGEGTSGRVHTAEWRPRDGAAQTVALKIFKGAMTSDGLPEREIAACLAAGAHPSLTAALAEVTNHPDGLSVLLMPRLPDDWSVLAGPPSLASCSRDVYAPDVRLSLGTVMRIARAVASATAHLHDRSLLHGDLYAHNILWDGTAGNAVLSDFGAACVMPATQADGWQRVEVRAWGVLLGELLDRCTEHEVPSTLRDLEAACVQADVFARPSIAEVAQRLDAAEL